jgi:hypothetical protein
MTRNETHTREMRIGYSRLPCGNEDWKAHSTMSSVTTLVDRQA